MKWLSFPFALLAGALITVQTGANSRLKDALGQPMPAVIVNYIVGLIGVLVYTLAKRVEIPTLANAVEAPWWAWTGGLFGAVYGITAVILARPLGAATLTALVVTGQLVCSVALDHFGGLGFQVHPASWERIAGCALMVVGLALIAKF
jgi:bacterial/archaeal transporter family-2 protein